MCLITIIQREVDREANNLYFVSGYFITLGGWAPQIGSLAKGIASSSRGRWKRKSEGEAATGIATCYIVSFL